MSLSTILTHEYSWVTKHIFLLVVTAALVLGSVYGVENLISKHDVTEAARYAQIEAAQVAQTQALEKELAANEAQWSQVEKTMLDENAKLADTISKQNAQVGKQRKVDETLNAQQAADRLSKQTNASPNEVTAQGDNVLLDLPITRSIVSSLDLLAGTESELVATKSELANEVVVADNKNKDLQGKDSVIQNLEAQNKDAAIACNAQITVVKAQARKSKLRWFGAGFVAGFISKRLLLGKW